jgi:hypothetical protein
MRVIAYDKYVGDESLRLPIAYQTDGAPSLAPRPLLIDDVQRIEYVPTLVTATSTATATAATATATPPP